MNIGVIIPLYNAAELIERCLEKWTDYKSVYPDHSVYIVCIDGKFNEFQDDNPNHNSNDGTIDILVKNKASGVINDYVLAPEGLFENDIRNIGLEKCRSANCDILWNVDSDEFYTVEEIHNIVQFVESKRFISYFSIHFRNLVFDENTWLDDFCPPRIWKIKYGDMILQRFHWDNDCEYSNGTFTVLDKALAHVKIPKKIAFVRHETWLSNERSRRKVEYQEKHFGPPRGAGCSYKWNYDLNQLEFNEDFFKKTNQTKPVLNHGIPH